MTNGSCLCGKITYKVSGSLRPVVACHCQQCRKTSGHHVAATSALREDIKIQGNVSWYASSSDARRGFCGTCGSQLFWDGPGSHLSIFAGTLDTPTHLKLAGHIFCTDKGDYYDLTDNLPCADADDPKLTTQVKD
ncbi:GFA family protein [Parasulfitobacter algicola]|uniref:GFA family protein n=1 Tax=Parasulfitobacter algicola TaxID=2614809 RepID=A0ABX2IUW1_9RHOB|nr:GFA family protein [Sulfitobacter algicola]NSX56699.1 GFA family protein [Sulfitobacter algicola]